MTYAGYVTTNPLFWSAVTGFALGGALASATRRVSRARRPGRARSRKWTAAMLFLTAAVVASTLGLLLPSRLVVLSLQSLYVLCGSLVFAALAFRFPRAAGVPALLILSVVAVASVAVMREWLPIREDTPLAIAHVLAADETRFFAETEDRTPGAPSAGVIEVPGNEIAPVVDIIEISRYLFFLGADRGMRLAAITDRLGDPPPYEPGWLPRLTIDLVPLLAVRREPAPSSAINLLRTYQLVGRPTGEPLRVVAVNE